MNRRNEVSTEWTIATLKEHLESEIAALREREKIKAEALVLQANEYERRLTALNGEQARIAANQSASVSREIWDSAQREDREWKRRIETAISEKLPRGEFQTYKDVTDKALTLKAGQSQGIGITTGVIVQIIASLASIGAIVTVILLMGHR